MSSSSSSEQSSSSSRRGEKRQNSSSRCAMCDRSLEDADYDEDERIYHDPIVALHGEEDESTEHYVHASDLSPLFGSDAGASDPDHDNLNGFLYRPLLDSELKFIEESIDEDGTVPCPVVLSLGNPDRSGRYPNAVHCGKRVSASMVAANVAAFERRFRCSCGELMKRGEPRPFSECGHRFHGDCIIKHVASNPEGGCLMCRAPRADRRAERIDITRLTDEQIAGRGLLRLVVTETFACDVVIGWREPVPGMLRFLNSNSAWSNSYNANEMFNGLQRREVVYENPSAELLVACLRRIIQRRPSSREREPVFFSDSGVLYCDVLFRGDFGYSSENGMRAELYERGVWRFDDAEIELKNMEFMRDSTPAIRNYINVNSVSVRVGIQATDLTGLRIAQSIMAITARFLADDPIFAGGSAPSLPEFVGKAKVLRRTFRRQDSPGFVPSPGVRNGTDPGGFLRFLRESAEARYFHRALFGSRVLFQSPASALAALAPFPAFGTSPPIEACAVGVSVADFLSMCLDVTSSYDSGPDQEGTYDPNFYFSTYFTKPSIRLRNGGELVDHHCLVGPVAAERHWLDGRRHPKIFQDADAHLWRGRTAASVRMMGANQGSSSTDLGIHGERGLPAFLHGARVGDSVSRLDVLFAASASVVDLFDLSDEVIHATVSERYVDRSSAVNERAFPSLDDWVHSFRIRSYRELMELLTTVFMPHYVHSTESSKGDFEVAHVFTVSGLEVVVRCPVRGPASLFSRSRWLVGKGGRDRGPRRDHRCSEARVSLFFEGAWRAYAAVLRLVELEARFVGARPSWPPRAFALPRGPDECRSPVHPSRPSPVGTHNGNEPLRKEDALCRRTHPFEYLYGGGTYQGLACYRAEVFAPYNPGAWASVDGPFGEAVRAKAEPGSGFAVLSTLDRSQVHVLSHYVLSELRKLPSHGTLSGSLRATAADLAAALLDAVAVPEERSDSGPLKWSSCHPSLLVLSASDEHCSLARTWELKDSLGLLSTEVHVMRNTRFGFSFESLSIDESFKHAVSLVYAASPAEKVEEAAGEGGPRRSEWFPAPMDSLGDLVAFADRFKPPTVGDVAGSWGVTRAVVLQGAKEVGAVMRRLPARAVARPPQRGGGGDAAGGGDWVRVRTLGAVASAADLGALRRAWVACSERARAQPGAVLRGASDDGLVEIVREGYGRVAGAVAAALSAGRESALSGPVAADNASTTMRLVVRVPARWSAVRAVERIVVRDQGGANGDIDWAVASALEELEMNARSAADEESALGDAPTEVIKRSFPQMVPHASTRHDRKVFYEVYSTVLSCGVRVRVDGPPGPVSWVVLEWDEALVIDRNAEAVMPTMDKVRSEFPAYDYYSGVIIEGFSSPFSEVTPAFDVLPRHAIGGCRSVTLHLPLKGYWRDTHAPLPRTLPASLEELVIGDGLIYQFKARDALCGELPQGITSLDLGCGVSVDRHDDWTWDWASASGAPARLVKLRVSGVDVKFSELNHRLPPSLARLKLEGLFSNRGLPIDEENSPANALLTHSRNHLMVSGGAAMGQVALCLGSRFTNAGAPLDLRKAFPEIVFFLEMGGVSGEVRFPAKRRDAYVELHDGFRNGGKRSDSYSRDVHPRPTKCALCLGGTLYTDAPDSVFAPIEMVCTGCASQFHLECLLEESSEKRRAIGAAVPYDYVDPSKRVLCASCPLCGRPALPSQKRAFADASGPRGPPGYRRQGGGQVLVVDRMLVGPTTSDAEIVELSDALRRADELPGRKGVTPFFTALHERHAVAVTVTGPYKSLSDEAEAVRAATGLLAASRLPTPHAPFVVAGAIFSPLFMRGPFYPAGLRTLSVSDVRPGHLLPFCLKGALYYPRKRRESLCKVLALCEPTEVESFKSGADYEVSEAEPPLWRVGEMAKQDEEMSGTWDFVFMEVMRRWPLETLSVTRRPEGRVPSGVKLTPFVLDRAPRGLVSLEIYDPDSVLVAPMESEFLPSSLKRLVLRVGGILWTQGEGQVLMIKGPRDQYGRFGTVIEAHRASRNDVIPPRFLPGGLEQLELAQLRRELNEFNHFGLDAESLPGGLRELTLGGGGTDQWDAKWDVHERYWIEAIARIESDALTGASKLERLSVDDADVRGAKSVLALATSLLHTKREGVNSLIAPLPRDSPQNIGMAVPPLRAGEAERTLGPSLSALAGQFYQRLAISGDRWRPPVVGVGANPSVSGAVGADDYEDEDAKTEVLEYSDREEDDGNEDEGGAGEGDSPESGGGEMEVDRGIVRSNGDSLLSVHLTDGEADWFVAPSVESMGLRAVTVNLTETFAWELPRASDAALVASWTEVLGRPRASADGTLRFRKEFSAIVFAPSPGLCVALAESVDRAARDANPPAAPRVTYSDFDYAEDRGRQAVVRVECAGTRAEVSAFAEAAEYGDELARSSVTQAVPWVSAELTGRSEAAAVRFAVPRAETARAAFRAIVDAATDARRARGDRHLVVEYRP